MLHLMTLYTTQRKQYAGPTKAITGSVLNKSQARKWELRFVQEFRYLGHVMTADCQDDKDIKNNS